MAHCKKVGKASIRKCAKLYGVDNAGLCNVAVVGFDKNGNPTKDFEIVVDLFNTAGVDGGQ